MVATFKLVERATPANVVFDFDSTTGTMNPGSLVTSIITLDIGQIKRPLSLVKQTGSPLGARVSADPQFRHVEVHFTATAPDGKLYTLVDGVGELYRILTSEAIEDCLLAFDDGSGVRFLEPLGVEDGAASLRAGSSQIVQRRATLAGDDIDFTLEIVCQPYLVSSERDAAVNLLANATLGGEGANGLDPDGWGLDSATNISARALDASEDAYTLTIATTSARNLQQDTGAGTAVAGDVFTFAFDAEAAAGGIARMRAVIRYLDSGGTTLGSESVSAQVTLTTAWQRIAVTSSAAPASTSQVRVYLRFENIAATSVQVWLRDAQCEEAPAATPFRVGPQTVSASPVAPLGMGFPIVIDGTAPTPVTFDFECGTGSVLTSMQMAARWNHGRDGFNRILDYLNRTNYVPMATAFGWTITYGTQTTYPAGDDDAANGNAAQVSISATQLGERVMRMRAVRTTNLESLRGEWLVLARVRAMQVGEEWKLQLHYATTTLLPMSNSEEPVTHLVDTADTNPTKGYEYVPIGILRIPERGPLGAVAMEVQIARTTDSGIDTKQLNLSNLFLVPNAPRTKLVVPGGGKVRWDRNEFLTQITGNPGETLTVSDRVQGAVRMDFPNEAMGVAPNTGQLWGSGQATVTFDVDRADDAHPFDYLIRVTKIGPSPTFTRSIATQKYVRKAGLHRLKFNADLTLTYQPQAVHKGVAGKRFTISRITREFVPAVGNLQHLVSDPESMEVTLRDGSSNVIAVGGVEGQTPFVLEPGRYVISVIPGEVASGGHDNDNAAPSDGSGVFRTYIVRTRYSPRWMQ